MSSSWVHAAIFNVMLVVIPVLASSVVSSVFAARDFPATPRLSALEATRENILDAFTGLAVSGEDMRSHWAGLVDSQLQARNMSAARGFLLAAPQMLDEQDRKAVAEAAPQAVPFGTIDEQLVGAALLFLPNDVRVRYEGARRPPISETPSRPLLPGQSAPLTPPTSMPEPTLDEGEREGESTPPAVRLASSDSVVSDFSVLGSRADLVHNSRDWLSESPGDALSLRLTGLGLMADELDLPAGVDLTETASLLKAAERAGRLSSPFRARLILALDDALPTTTLRTRLDEELRAVRPTSEQADAVAGVFSATLRRDRLALLTSDSLQINEIVDAVGPVPTLAMIEHIDSEIDLRRARLVAEAGGDRAVALEVALGARVLNTADTGVELARRDVLEIMGLAAATMALLWMVLLGMQRNMISPIRPLRYE